MKSRGWVPCSFAASFRSDHLAAVYELWIGAALSSIHSDGFSLAGFGSDGGTVRRCFFFMDAVTAAVSLLLGRSAGDWSAIFLAELAPQNCPPAGIFY